MAEFAQNNQARHHQAGCQDKLDESHAAQLAVTEPVNKEQRQENDEERAKKIPQIVRARLDDSQHKSERPFFVLSMKQDGSSD
jgi:hypothetical protein